jgi:hypothetical protein
MQEQLKKALDFANYKQTLAIQRRTLKEKINAKLTFGYNGGLFKIDRELISFVETLLSKNRVSGVVLLDKNDNPILVDDLQEFQEDILSKYFEATNEYLEQYQALKKSRSVEKLIDL